MDEKIYFNNSEGDRLCGILVSASDIDQPIVILAHGHNSNKNTNKFVTLSELLEQKNISTFRIDLYGHGESEGTFEEATVSKAVDSILSAIEYVKKIGYKKIGLVGSSYGGLASIISAAKSKDLSVLVLKSPVSNYADLFTEDRIKKWKEKGYIDYEDTSLILNYSFYEDLDLNNGYEWAPKIKIPTLVFHGDFDKDVPIEQSKKLSTRIPQCTLVILKGADHRYTQGKHANEMLTTTVDFLIDIL